MTRDAVTRNRDAILIRRAREYVPILGDSIGDRADELGLDDFQILAGRIPAHSKLVAGRLLDIERLPMREAEDLAAHGIGLYLYTLHCIEDLRR